MVDARLDITDYTNRVLNVIKARFGLNDKSEALNKFADLFGEEFVEKEASDEYIKRIIELEKSHRHGHPERRMTKKELDELFGKNV